VQSPLRRRAPRATAAATASATTGPSRERILEAAEAFLRRHGLRRLSMGEVARAARLSRGSVYRYFRERDALVEAVLERAADRFVASSLPAVRRRKTLAAQVGEAAVFIREHLRDELVSLHLPAEEETLVATLLTAQMHGVLARWVAFWEPFLRDAQARGEVRADLERAQAGEWIVRMLLSIAVMPSVTVDLDAPGDVRAFVQSFVVRGLGA
jgi:AcrR family transcriptional regulator